MALLTMTFTSAPSRLELQILILGGMHHAAQSLNRRKEFLRLVGKPARHALGGFLRSCTGPAWHRTTTIDVGCFRLTVSAEGDLLDIAEYTRRTWGEQQCARYLDQLEECCQRLADHPVLGRACDNIRSGLRRCEQGKYVIFYRRDHHDILIVRILRERMLPELHIFEG